MIAQIRKAQRDQPNDHGTGGVDHRIADVLLAHVAARVFRDDLCGAGYLKHIVKTNVEQSLKDKVHVV